MKRTILALVLSFGLITSQGMVFADEIITRDAAIQMAVDNSDAKESLYDNLSSVRSSIRSVKSMSDQLETAIKYAKDDDYEDTAQSLVNAKAQYESLNTTYLQLNNTYENFDLNLAAAVDQILVNYFYLNEMMPVQNDYMQSVQKSYETAKAKYELGLISENDYMDAFDTFNLAHYNYRQTYYSKENLELQLKQLLNLDYDTLLSFQDTYMIDLSSNVQPLSYYQALASENRVDLLNAKLALVSAENMVEWYKYGFGDVSNELASKMGLESAQSEYEDTVSSVIADVRSAYDDVQSAYKTLELAKLTLESKEAALSKAQISYDQGLATDNDLILATYARDMQVVSVNNATRSLTASIYALDRATVIE